MPALRITMFGGIVPRLAKRGLPDNAAQSALNAKLYSGELRAWNHLKVLNDALPISNPATVFHYRNAAGTDKYKAFAQYTNVAKGALINDQFGRYYFTGETGGAYINTAARWDAAQADYLLGVPVPGGTPIVVTPAGGTAATAETRVYLCTLVTNWGEESGPGVPVTAAGNADGTWTITGLHTQTYSAGTYPNVAKLRLYRTISSDTGVDYRMVNEWDVGSRPASYVDNVSATTLASQPVMDSLTWSVPPTSLKGLVAVAGGFLVGFKGKTVYASVPFYPHAWPEDYQWAVEDNIVGLGTFGSAVVILTEGRAYVLIGDTPDMMSLQKMEAVQPCLSKRSIVSTSQGVVYATTEGLAVIDGTSTKASIISQAWVTKDEWKNYSPGTQMSAVYQDRYLTFYGSTLGFTLGFDDPVTGFTDLQSPLQISSVDVDTLTGQTLISSGTSVYEWDGLTTSSFTYVWRSKPFQVPKPMNLGAAQLRGSFVGNSANIPVPPAVPSDGFAMNDDDLNGPINNAANHGGSLNGPALWQSLGISPAPAAGGPAVSFKLYADGNLVHFVSIDDEKPFRLPSGYKGEVFEVELEGVSPLFSCVLATTMKGLEEVT